MSITQSESGRMARNGEKWYIGGLHFDCLQCGNCCAGPEEGYIWICKKEIEMLAEHLGVSPDSLRQNGLLTYGKRYSIREDPLTKDCMYLTDFGGSRGCAIYPCRPNQCRTWPFWSSNLRSPMEWNAIATTCPGVNRGRLYTFEEIEALRNQTKWWNEDDGTQSQS